MAYVCYEARTISIEPTRSMLLYQIPGKGTYTTNNKLIGYYSDIAALLGIKSNMIVKGNTILDVVGTYEGTDTRNGTVNSSDLILEGYIGYSNGNEYTGTMKNFENKEDQEASTVEVLNNFIKLSVPVSGYYTEANYIKKSFADIAKAIDLTPDKIAEGETVLGVEGTARLGVNPNGVEKKFKINDNTELTYGDFVKLIRRYEDINNVLSINSKSYEPSDIDVLRINDTVFIVWFINNGNQALYAFCEFIDGNIYIRNIKCAHLTDKLNYIKAVKLTDNTCVALFGTDESLIIGAFTVNFEGYKMSYGYLSSSICETGARYAEVLPLGGNNFAIVYDNDGLTVRLCTYKEYDTICGEPKLVLPNDTIYDISVLPYRDDTSLLIYSLEDSIKCGLLSLSVEEDKAEVTLDTVLAKDVSACKNTDLIRINDNLFISSFINNNKLVLTPISIDNNEDLEVAINETIIEESPNGNYSIFSLDNKEGIYILHTVDGKIKASSYTIDSDDLSITYKCTQEIGSWNTENDCFDGVMITDKDMIIVRSDPTLNISLLEFGYNIGKATNNIDVAGIVTEITEDEITIECPVDEVEAVNITKTLLAIDDINEGDLLKYKWSDKENIKGVTKFDKLNDDIALACGVASQSVKANEMVIVLKIN